MTAEILILSEAIAVCELAGRSIEMLERDYALWDTWVRSELVRVGRACSGRR